MAKRKSSAKRVSKDIYELQATICSALAHAVRLEILDLIAEQEMNASELQEILDIPKANLSQHLSVLKEAGLVQTRKEGLYHYYGLAIPKIKNACAMVRSLLLTKATQDDKQNTVLIKELKAAKG